MTLATSTLELSVTRVATAFGAAILAAANDATAISETVRGLSDGNDYGRYFVGQDPLLAYAPFAGSLDELIAQGVALRAAIATAVAAMIDAADAAAASFADSAQASVEALRAACPDPGSAIRIFTALAGFDDPVLVGADPIGTEITQLAANASVLMRRLAAIALAQASAVYQPNSQGDAQSVRDAVANVLDTIALEAADRFEDNSYAALDALRVKVVNDLTQRGASLAPVAIRAMPAPLPAPVVAYRLYQDSGRADELVARNDPPHPAFLPLAVEALIA